MGLGPGDPNLLTIGSLDALRRCGRAVALQAPPDLRTYLTNAGVNIEHDLVPDAALLVRGSAEAVLS